MKSYAHQVLSPTEIAELAAEFPDEEVKESLNEDEDNIVFLLAWGDDGRTSRMTWNAYCGPMINMDDDSVRVYAQKEYAFRHGYPVIHSFDAIEDYATLHSWPRKPHPSGSKWTP